MITAEGILEEKGSDMISVSPETFIHDALSIMIDKRIGAMLVKQAEEYVGIWTERDLMQDTLKDGFDTKTAKIGDYMTTGLISVEHDADALQLADQFLGRRLRHLLVKRDGRYIGMLSSGDVLKAALRERADRVDEYSEIVKLEFYEKWRWQKRLQNK